MFRTPNGTFDTKRLESFSDAVLAVAITLMVLRIAPPVARDGQDLAEVFWQSTVPEIAYFLITFAVIVIFWLHHHDLFRVLPREVSPEVVWWNMGFLACVCLLPFGLEFFSDEASLLTTGVYAGLMALATMFLGALGRMASGRWRVETFVGAGVFVLAIPFAPLLGGWCLLIWWLDVPLNTLINHDRSRSVGTPGPGQGTPD